MYTKSITVQEVPMKTFIQMEKIWGTKRRKHTDRVYSRIVNPLRKEIGDDDIESVYYQFIDNLLDHEYALRLCVNDHGDWIKPYVDEITQSEEIRDLARIAAHDGRKLLYLEMRYQKENRDSEFVAVIEFMELDNVIVSSQVRVPNHLSDLFDIRLIKEREYYKFNEGLWVPEYYMQD